jgi:transposase
VVLRRKFRRLALEEVFERLPRCIVGMEACLSAHFVSRTLRRLGFEPRIVPAIYVRPFAKGQKNDYNNAEAIAEASLRPNLRTVREKTQDQLDLEALHRVRSRLVSRRTATINQIRAFLIEQGIAGAPGSPCAPHVALPDPRAVARRGSAAAAQAQARVSLANKLARITWSVLRHDRAFDAPGDQATAI